MFIGFQSELFTFLRGIEDQNSKDWFEAHRSDYEIFFKEAAQDMIADISSDMAQLRPALMAVPKVNGSLRRINRDVRFSKDKTPYHSHMHLVFWAGDHANRSAGMHFIIKHNAIGYGAGHYGMTPDILARYRAAVCDPKRCKELESALMLAKTVNSELEPPTLARVPKGFEAKNETLLRHKSLVARTMEDHHHPSWLTSPEFGEGLLSLTHAHLPLIAWLHAL